MGDPRRNIRAVLALCIEGLEDVIEVTDGPEECDPHDHGSKLCCLACQQGGCLKWKAWLGRDTLKHTPEDS